MGITESSVSSEKGPVISTWNDDMDLYSEDDNITFSEDLHRCVVGVIDIVDSTRISAHLDKARMSKYYSMFLNWTVALVKGFGGKVVKNTGDGLLFYFVVEQEQADIAIRRCLDCSTVLSGLHGAINSKFHSDSLPPINYRISLDYGEVVLAKVPGSLVPDVFGTVVNVCTKINGFASSNTVVIGGDLYCLSKQLSGYTFHETGKSISIDKHPYPTYKLADSTSTDRIRHLNLVASKQRLRTQAAGSISHDRRSSKDVGS